jgi:hypothetical protein
MENGPLEALDTIRKQLQLILARAEMCGNSRQCEPCAGTVGEIVREIRKLEAYVQETLAKAA